MELLVPVDAEQAIIDELKSRDYAYVGTSIPQVKPNIFVRVVAVGGSGRDMVTGSPMVVIDVFALLETRALAEANRILALLVASARHLGAIGGRTCYGVQVAGLPQNLPLDSVPTHKRYTFTIVPDLRHETVEA